MPDETDPPEHYEAARDEHDDARERGQCRASAPCPSCETELARRRRP
jgi:hypothetical protein